MEIQYLFENARHQMHFEALVAQGEGELTPAQEAFVYLIAMAQDDYESYEGMPFYIEVFESVSIDGPVYLLEDCVDLSTYRHERILAYAKDILKGKAINLERVEKGLQPWVKCAYGMSKRV